MIVKIISIGLFLLFLVVGYVGIQGYSEHQKAEAAKAEGDLTAAITHYQRSIKWYLPGAFTSQRRLRACGRWVWRRKERGTMRWR